MQLGSLIFFAIVVLAKAQTGANYIVDQFNTDTTAQFVDLKWGMAIPNITWSTNNGGSARWVIPWTTTNDQIMVTRSLTNGINLNNYDTLSFDIQFAPTSATNGNESFGALEIDWTPQSAGWPSIPNPPEAITTFSSGNTNWIHVVMPINASGISNLTTVNAIGFKIQQDRTGANLSGATAFWLDNIILTSVVNSPVTGPPQIVQLTPPQQWRRLELQVTNVPGAANPFDPDSIRLDATLTSPSGKTLIVPAFWYQPCQRSLSGGSELDAFVGSPQWRLRFTPAETGLYAISLAVQTNDQVYGAPLLTNFSVVETPLPTRFGYVGLSATNHYFQTGDGQGLPLNGEDVCWPSGRGTYDYENWFASMQASGENFTRVWMWPTSFGIEDNQGTLTNYAQIPAWQLDYVFQLAEQEGIYLQLMLVWHGMFVTQPDYWGGGNSWPQNPYNITNGGPCANPNAFFTNAVAEQLFQKRLRYLVARYGYSQNLVDWEFCNEIDNDYSFLSSTAVAAWHGLMGGWMETNDPYHHLMTTSLTYASEHPEIWTLPQMDFISEHSYNISSPANDLNNDTQNFIRAYYKPVMIGEYGTSWQGWNLTGDPFLRGFREGLWGGALGGSVGTAMAWWWQNIDTENDYGVYTALGNILNRTGWGRGPWTNIVFGAGSLSANSIGQSGAHESLIYCTASDANYPNGATNNLLPIQQEQTVTLTHWKAGSYYVAWFDPGTATPMGSSSSTTTNGNLTLPTPNFSVDLAGVVYPVPQLTVLGSSSNGWQFRLDSETDGEYLIQSSTNLADWTAYMAITNSTGGIVIDTPLPATNETIFFRALQLRE